MRAAEIMTTPIFYAREDATLEEIAKLMLERRVGCVPVVDRQGKLVGIISESDLMMEERFLPFTVERMPHLLGEWVPKEGLEQIYQKARSMRAQEIMNSPVVTAEEHESVTSVAERMLRSKVNHMPIVRQGTPVGMVARADLLRTMVDERPSGAPPPGRVPG